MKIVSPNGDVLASGLSYANAVGKLDHARIVNASLDAFLVAEPADGEDLQNRFPDRFESSNQQEAA